jgi:hypothetical protein
MSSRKKSQRRSPIFPRRSLERSYSTPSCVSGAKKVYKLCNFYHHPPRYCNYVFCGRVGDLNFESFRPQRAGVIPYIVREGEIYFALGLDTQHSELTDFGGGVSYKSDGNALEGALREFSEESLGVFGAVDRALLTKCFVVYNRQMMIVFVPFDVNPLDKSRLFHQFLLQETDPEVSDILWLSEQEFKTALEEKSRILYVRVRKLLSKAGDFCSFLKTYGI